MLIPNPATIYYWLESRYGLSRNFDIYKLADILGIQVVRRNKSIPEISYDNFLMSGWNMYATEKFQKILCMLEI